MNVEKEKPDLASLRINRDNNKGKQSTALWKIGLAVAVIVVLFAGGYLLFTGIFNSPVEVETTTASLTSPSQARAVLTASGYVVAQKKASIASKGTGRLVFLGVEEGDQVSRGEIIARLEDQDVRAALARTMADLELARADSFDAQQTFAREQTMFTSGLTSKAALDAAEARLLRTMATIKSALAAVSEAEVGLENTRIRAPFDGTVLTKDADVGEVVAPFASSMNSRGTVVTMADMLSLEVEADVSESNITRVAAGQSCEIVLDAYPQARYSGYVHKIVPTADRAKATVLTKVRFHERDARVLPEMSAKVSFLSEELSDEEKQASPTLTVNASAVMEDGGKRVAFVIEGGLLRKVSVELGERYGNRVEIIAGLTSGDRVVLSPDESLEDGMAVTIK